MSESPAQPGREFDSVPRQLESNPPHRILVVDDDDSLRQLNMEVLSQNGYAVEAAADGDIAWVTLQENNYDLLITDQKMPRVSGVELLKKLRAARMALPVIMATGTVPQVEFALYPWLQPTAVLLKPYTIPELLGVVHNVLFAERPRAQLNDLLAWRGQSPAIGQRLSSH